MPRLAASIIIATYNRASLVPRAVESALVQCKPGDQIIVIDDGSTDGTAEALAPFEASIRYIHVPNGGAGKARNIGISEARTPLVAFLDSDDEWMPGKLELHRSLMAARPDILFSFSDFAHHRPDGSQESRCLWYWHQDPRSWDEILGPGVPYSSIATLPAGIDDAPVHVGDLYLNQMQESYVFTSTLFVRREEAGDALRFAEDVIIYEDWECYGRLAGAGKAAFLDCETTWQHAHDASRITDADHVTTSECRLKVLHRVWGQDPEFMAKHREAFERTVDEQHCARARALIVNGRTREARDELKIAHGGPLHYRLLSWMPGSVARTLVGTRRVLRGSASPPAPVRPTDPAQ